MIIHEIYKSFGNGLGICGVFVDISKAFDKVLHKGLVYKISHNPNPSKPATEMIFSWKRFEHGNAIHGQPCKESFHQKLGSIQCNAALGITGAIGATSKETFYQGLGVESF